VAALLQSAVRARKNGNPAAARALLRALVAQQPDLPQAWLLLATVAETRVEQRRALEHVLTLDPHNEPARRGLARIGAAGAAVPAAAASPVNGKSASRPPTASAADASPGIGSAIAQPPAAAQEPQLAASPSLLVPAQQAARGAPALHSADSAPPQAAPDIRWPLYLVIGVSALIVLIAAIVLRGSEFAAALRPAATAALPVVGAATPVPASALETPAEPAGDPSAAPAAGVTTPPTSAAATAAPPTSLPTPTADPPTSTPSPPPTPRTLAPGEIVEQGQWHAILMRPEDAMALDGSIGSFQPRGGFVLALVAVGNDGQAPARLPDDLFVLVDAAGARYLPQPQISTAYLNAYGRGQHGDLSMEDPIPPDGGNKSVPLIFDVPPGARPLYLLAGDSPVGWPIIP
jgi:hypothetical protein